MANTSADNLEAARPANVANRRSVRCVYVQCLLESTTSCRVFELGQCRSELTLDEVGLLQFFLETMVTGPGQRREQVSNEACFQIFCMTTVMALCGVDDSFSLYLTVYDSHAAFLLLHVLCARAPSDAANIVGSQSYRVGEKKKKRK